MTVTVPVLGIIILIFVLHTIITHLLNWGYRKADDQQNPDNAAGVMLLLIFFNLLEIVICIGLLKYYIT
jgi:hypothetical protein